MLNTIAVVISTAEVSHKIAWEKTVHPVGSDCNYSVGSDCYYSMGSDCSSDCTASDCYSLSPCCTVGFRETEWAQTVHPVGSDCNYSTAWAQTVTTAWAQTVTTIFVVGAD